MDIRNWPLDRIMQLPDCCFGRRFVVSCIVQAGDAAPAWDISEIPFPEKAVIWELVITMKGVSQEIDTIRLVLGDALPTTKAQVDALEPVFAGLGLQGPSPRLIHIGWISLLNLRRIRLPILAAGRRLILEATGLNGKTPIMTVALVVSSIPTEVPDCLLSAHP
ncbi:hypothetical protein ES703_99032 [subsurface metagenome]